MSRSKKDPRTYVKQVPLPIPSQKGLKIQARCDTVYNPTSPTREHVRKENYMRRLKQMNEEGFHSPSHKPYQGIGDPFYLDQKALILHALGQWDENQVDSSSSSGDESSGDSHDEQDAQNQVTPVKFVLRRTRKDLNTLNKDLSQQRFLIRNVKLGHGLFDTLRNQKEAKENAKSLKEQQSKARQLEEWLPPKMDSSSDGGPDTDEELGVDVDLTQFMNEGASAQDPEKESVVDSMSLSTTQYDPDFKQRVTFSRPEISVNRPVHHRVKSAPSVRNSKKVIVPPRPYTPSHSNLTAHAENISKDALFRQLCALYWVLEAMNVEGPTVMGPITTCWDLKEIGGSRTTAMRIKKEKLTETRWEGFINNQSTATGARHGRRMTPQQQRTNRATVHRRRLSHPRVSVTSVNSLTSSQSQINLPGPHATPRKESTIPEESDEVSIAPTETTDEEDAGGYSKGLFKFLDDYYESLNRENEKQQEEAEAAAETVARQQDSAQRAERRKKRREKRAAENKELRSKTLDDSDERRTRNRLRDSSSSDLRANVHFIRPKSSPGLVEYKSSLPSNKYRDLPVDLRQRFIEISQEKSLVLHDALEQVERQRLRVCRNKFAAMRTIGGVYRTLKEMRSKSAEMEHKLHMDRSAKRTSVYTEWYQELIDGLPPDLKNNWYFEKICGKLEKYGLRKKKPQNHLLKVESGKQSAYRFLKVLSSLREWEICSPDIMAAIEYCRDRIIDMTVEDYEEWFRQQFPKITRPQTAPPLTPVKLDKSNSSERV